MAADTRARLAADLGAGLAPSAFGWSVQLRTCVMPWRRSASRDAAATSSPTKRLGATRLIGETSARDERSCRRPP